MNGVSPINLDQVEQLVESLYSPNPNPHYIKETQNALQAAQKSEIGWMMADKLLHAESPQCQFFGALTFTVKLNSLTKSDLEQLNPTEVLNQLLNWLVSRKSNSQRFVIQKLISTLSVFFTKFPEVWENCVLSIIRTIEYKTAVVTPSASDNYSFKLSTDDMLLCLQFANSLIEDQTGQFQLTSAKVIKINETLQKSQPVVSQLVRQALDSGRNTDDPDVPLIQKALETLEGWVSYFTQSRMDIAIFRPFSDYLMLYIQSSDEEIFETTSTMIVEIFTHSPSYWSPKFKDDLFSFLLQQAESVDKITEVDERVISFTKLLIAFLENIRKSYFLDETKTSDPKVTQLIHCIVVLTGIPGKPVVEDPIAIDCLEFWTSYVEDVEDMDVPKGLHQEVIKTVITLYFPKIMLPPPNQYESWSSENKEAFGSFRRDFTDFLEYSYPIVGLELCAYLVENVYRTLNEANIDSSKDYNSLNWQALECSLYCLNGFAETMEESDEAYSTIKALFSSSLLDDLPMANTTRVRQTAVNLIGSFDNFFMRPEGKPYLSQALEYLFKSLKVSLLSQTASRSIQKLCDSSRASLTQLLPNFMGVYKTLSLFSGLNPTAHDRTVNAISCIIQALGNLDEKAKYVDQLVSMIIQQIERVLNNPDENLIEWCVVLLRSLATVGKGLQVPEDLPNVSQEELERNIQFWDRDNYGIRKRITHVIKVLSIDKDPLNKQSDICKACCDIFRSGLCEVVSGPFVFPMDTILTFITSKYQQGPIITQSPLVDLSCCVVSSPPVEKNKGEVASEYVNILLECFFSQVHSSDYEPDIQSGQLKLLTQICQHKFSLLVSHSYIEVMANFAAHLLSSNDSFVLRGACQFWSKFVTNTANGDEDVKQRQDVIFQAVGPQIVGILADKISGGAIRSDLEYYSDLIKKLIFKYPMVSKPWFISAIVNQPVSGLLARRDEKLRKDIVTRLFNLRGGRETAQVVKEFWLSCRGIANYT